jgi:putative FmdB family regulatory protein
MPLYEYQCGACGHRFEIIQKFSDPPLETCPRCSGPVQKLQSAPAFHLKGTGWYVTDYAKKEAPADTKSDGGAKGTPSTEPAAKAEAAPKAEPKKAESGGAKTDKTAKTEKT